ncbi:hypothetical protein V3C99_012591 [Haemonchus contortus]
MRRIAAVGETGGPASEEHPDSVGFNNKKSDDEERKGFNNKKLDDEAKEGDEERKVTEETANGNANQKQPSQSHMSTWRRRMYGPADLVKIFIPVSICMLLVVVCVRSIEIYRKDYRLPVPELEQSLYGEPTADTSAKLWHSLKIVAGFVIFIICATFAVLALFYFECYVFLYGYVLFATFTLLTALSFIQCFDVFSAIGEPVSVVLVVFIIGNFVAVSLLAIFWKGPMKVQQGSLIALGAMTALTLLQFVPKWTCWLLVVVIAVWDVIAVLTPCGPLRMLVELAEKRDKDIMPAMIYTGSMDFASTDHPEAQQPEAIKSNSPKDGAKKKPYAIVESFRMPNFTASDDEEGRVRLGLGDFIFYSLLVGLAAANDDWTTTVACYVAIVTGLGFTMLLLVIAQHALPALPISILFGVFTVFSSRYILSELVLELNRKLIVV